MKTPVLAFAGLLFLASGALAQNQPAPGGFTGMPISAPSFTSASDVTTLGTVPPQVGADIANRIKLRGYVDFMLDDTDIDAAGDTTEIGNAGVDLDFLFDFSPVTAEVHTRTDNDDGFELEQAFVNYSVNPNFSISFGRQLQLLGFEKDESPDLYQISRGYAGMDEFASLLNKASASLTASDPAWAALAAEIDGVYGSSIAGTGALAAAAAAGLDDLRFNSNYNEGVRFNFNAGRFGLAVGLHDKIYEALGHDAGGWNDGNYGIEVQAAFMITPGLEARLGYARENVDDMIMPLGSTMLGTTAVDDKIDQLNFWISYQTGDLTLAFEFNDWDVLGTDGQTYLGLLNYMFTSRIGATVRYTHEDMDGLWETNKISIAPSVAVTENLKLIFEYSYTDFDLVGVGQFDVNAVAVEGLFIF